MFIADGVWAERLQLVGASAENTLRYDDARQECAFSKVILSEVQGVRAMLCAISG